MSTGQPYPGNIDESQDQYTVSVSRSIRATPERIWKVIGTAEGMRDWMYMLNWQPRLGGRMLLDVSGASEAERIIVFGRVLEIEEARLVRMSWRVLHEDGRLWPDDTEVAISWSLSRAARSCDWCTAALNDWRSIAARPTPSTTTAGCRQLT